MFDDLIADMDAAVQSTFAKQGVLNDKYVVDVVIDQDVLRVNDFGESIRNGYEISFFNDQVTGLVKGNTVDIQNDRYTLTVPIQGDTSITVWAANVA